MVPAAYIHLEELPLTPNGKIDRSRLNEQNNPIQSADIQQVSPCNKIEETLLEIAHDILGREDFGVTDNLKLLGMNSIQAMRIAIRARQKGYAIRVAELIKYQTIRQLHVDGISMSRWLNVQDKGKPIVVYVLGISGETESCHLMQELQDKYRVLLFENLTEIYTSLSDKNVDMLMDDYLSILHKELNGEGVHAFIGHSFGGEMAYRLAGRWSLLSDWRTQVVVLDNVPWTDSRENFWKLLKDRIDDKHLTLPKTVAERLEMSILINDIVIQMRRTSNVCPSYDLPIHLFVSTKHSGIDDVFNYINEMDTDENRTVLSEILDTDDMARTIDVEGMWHKNHKGSLTVSYIPDTHMGMLKKEYISLYLDSLNL
jgi:aryl carrier-like protein